MRKIYPPKIYIWDPATNTTQTTATIAYHGKHNSVCESGAQGDKKKG